jgi:hypothetical protein
METAVFVSAGILLTLLGGVAGVVLGRYVWPAIRGSDPAAFLGVQTEAARLEEECRSLRMRAERWRQRAPPGLRSCGGQGRKRQG